MELVLEMIDSSNLEEAAGLVTNSWVFYPHGQAWNGAGSYCLSFSPPCMFTGQAQGAGVFSGPRHFNCTKFCPWMMDFPAAFTWVWADCWGCAGSEHSLKNKGFNYIDKWERGKNTTVGKAVNSCTSLSLKLRVWGNSLALRANLKPWIYGSN